LDAIDVKKNVRKRYKHGKNVKHFCVHDISVLSEHRYQQVCVQLLRTLTTWHCPHSPAARSAVVQCAPCSTHTHPFNGPLSGTTRVSRYQKGKTNLDFTEARDSGWQWHQLGRMQVCTSLQTDNHTSTAPLLCFYRPDALPAAQPTASKH